jgi:hypothetical protein
MVNALVRDEWTGDPFQKSIASKCTNTKECLDHGFG